MSTDAARTQGQTDAALGRGPAATHTWSAVERNAYDAAYQQQQQKK
jgi:hypothetical protein